MRKNGKGNRNNRSLIPHKEIIERYISGESIVKLSRAVGISNAGVWGILKRNHIPRRDKATSEKMKRKYDYDLIIKDYLSGMFLSGVAKKYSITSAHVLKIITDAGHKSRGREGTLKGDKHPLWKGGKTHDHDGYVVQKEGRVHRLLMEETLQRKLFHWESVHHVDGNKTNYDLSNLVVMSGREHIRFHTFLRQYNLPITRENLDKFCIKENEFWYKFPVGQYEKHCLLLGGKVGLNKKGRAVCQVKGCDGVNAGYKRCSKHYQRYIAKKRGYWKSGGGRKATFTGKLIQEKK